ncbi:MAG TPA: hypothetical protein VGS04_07185 [Nitrososphaerales archaeon]|nr:hypothetical protein [Nitrososphaerales archaeon]
MPEASGTREPPPPELVRGETPYWKMADVKGLVVRHLVTGYLVTNYRCFIWDVESNVVRASVPIGLADVTVERRRPGKRSKRGGGFIVPQTVNYAQPAMGEAVEMGDLLFLVKGKPVMAFREVADPLNVKALIDALKAHSKAHMRPPRGVGVDTLWSDPDEAAGNRT